MGAVNKDINFSNNNFNYDQDNKIIFDLNDLNFICGNIKSETKQITEDINNLQNIIGNYKERIKEAVNYVIPQANPNSSAHRQHLNNPNLIYANNPIGNVNRNVTIFDNQQLPYSINNANILK